VTRITVGETETARYFVTLVVIATITAIVRVDEAVIATRSGTLMGATAVIGAIDAAHFPLEVVVIRLTIGDVGVTPGALPELVVHPGALVGIMMQSLGTPLLPE